MAKPNAALEALRQEYAACACMNVRKAARLVTQIHDLALKPVGLSSQQFSILLVLQTRGPMQITKLAQSIGVDRTTLTRSLRVMAKAKLVDIAVGGADRRARDVDLELLGYRKLMAALPLWKGAERLVLQRVGPEVWEKLRDSLGALDAATSAQASVTTGEQAA
jgi:DNA-binding MarR family transcriptional regulator